MKYNFNLTFIKYEYMYTYIEINSLVLTEVEGIFNAWFLYNFIFL